jgi:hypothetical protein
LFDPHHRLIDEVAAAINRNAPEKLARFDEFVVWAKRRYNEGYLLLDEDGRSVPLSPAQITKAAGRAATLRGR